jgi:hypothetical protein
MGFEVGDITRLKVVFRNGDGDVKDPTVVRLIVQSPTGSQQVFVGVPIVRDSTGTYHYDLELLIAGTYSYRWEATGDVEAVFEGQVEVLTTLLKPNTGIAPGPNDLTTWDTVKEWLNIPTDDSRNLYQRLITRCSTDILTKMNRTSLIATTVEEVRNGNGNDRLTLHYWPIMDVAKVVINNIEMPASPDGVQTGWVNDQYAVELVTTAIPATVPGIAFPLRFIRGYQNVRITYTYGFSSIPGDVEQACIDLVAYRSTIGRNKVGIKSEALTGVGTITYNTDAVPDSVKAVIKQYSIPMFVQ